MTDAESHPAMEEAMPTTPDVVLDSDSYKAGQSLEVDKDDEAPLRVEGDRVEEGAEPCGDDVMAAEPFGIAEDPAQADITKADEPVEGAGVEVWMDEVSAAVDDLREEGAAPIFSTTVNDSAEVGLQTYKVTFASDDLSKVGAALVDDGSKVVSAGGMHRSDGQMGQEVGGGSIDDIGEAAHFVSDVGHDGVSMENDVAVSVSGEPAQDERPQMDVALDMLNVVETDVLQFGNRAADESTIINVSVQNEDDNEVEGVGMISAAVTNEEGRHLVEATTNSGDNKGNDIRLMSSIVTNEGIQTDRVVAMQDHNEQLESSTVGDDHTEEKGMQMDAITMIGRTDKEYKIGGEDTADEALNGAVGMVANEGKLPMDGAGDDVLDEEAEQMDQANLAGTDNEQKEVPTADDDEVKQDSMQMDATARANDKDSKEGTDGEDAAEEAVDDTVGDNVPEEEAAVDKEDDDDKPPLLTMKGEGRRKRGRPSSKTQALVKPSTKKKDEEEVCFICFDGGDLVICDRRGCPKAYHPSCVNRDDDFFKSKGRWNCGWHICSNCQKPACHMCYTCTYSLCKACIKEAKFVCVRGSKGFCDTCINTVMMIENKEEATDQMEVDFDDKSSWWFLFKDYWLNLKASLSLTFEEISGAKSQKSRSSSVIHDNDLYGLPDNNDEEANSESSLRKHVESNSLKKRGRKRSKQAIVKDGFEEKESAKNTIKRSHSTVRDTQASPGKKARTLSKHALSSQIKGSESVGTSTSSAEEASWASEELLNFVAHMRNGDKSVLTQFDVQHLLLEYIKRKNLRDPRRKSQIVCDSLLQNLFAKERVGHFEMLKLLESHFLMSDVSPVDADDNHGGVANPDPSQDADGNSEASVVMSSEKRRKSRKYDQKSRQPNLDEYAAIDNHNIALMYLRRNVMEELISDVESFVEKVVGSFVRIRIPGTGQRQDIYRLVQIVGTGRAAESYKFGKKTADITLDIVNLDKREVVTVDIISNQEFTEEECKRLRQSIKYGFIPRLTVGEVQEKARVLQAVKVNDWIESEKMRLGHLRDRASDMGHRKELRECVEKLKLLSTPEERVRRLNEEPEIHADPTMDPDYESPEEQEQEIERGSFSKSRGSFSRKDGSLASPGKGDGRNVSHRDSQTHWESNRNTWADSSSLMESSLARRSTFTSPGESAGSNVDALTVQTEATVRHPPQGPSGIPSRAKPASQATINESEKIWQYIDPTKKIQGPFSIVQLRKWNSNGYFPPDLKIWKATEKPDDSILLTDALMGKFEKDLPPWEPPHVTSSQIDKAVLKSHSDVGTRHCHNTLVESTKTGELTPKSVDPNRPQSFSGKDQRHDYGTNKHHGSTMIQSPVQGYYGIQNSQAAYTSQQSLAESWNAPSQDGATVNPMTSMQPAMGAYSSGQNIFVPGNTGNLTTVPAPAPSNAEMVTSGIPSQNTMLANRSESKLGTDASSHGKLSSTAEDLGPLGAEPGSAQMNNQQVVVLSDTRNQMSSADASNSMMPSQLTSTQSAESMQRSATAIASGDSKSSGWSMSQVANRTGQVQVAGNMNLGTVLQGDASMGWGLMGQSNMSMPWGGAPVQGAAYNMLTMPTQSNAVPNMGWLANPGNTNMNMIWAAAQGQGTPNAAAMMGTEMQGIAMSPWGGIASGNANTYPGWGTQAGNVNQNIGWGGTVQGNSAQWNNNMIRNSSNGNRDWDNQQQDIGGRHYGNHGASNAGDAGGRPWKPFSGGDEGPKGPEICQTFRDQGVCMKDNCKYAHPGDGYPSRNEKRMDRQHSGNERRCSNHNERNDRQFDRQPSKNERHYDKHDGRHSVRAEGRHDGNQADRSQSREPC